MKQWLGKAALGTTLAAGLYLVFIIYHAGQNWLAMLFLALLALLGLVYSSEKLYAWRYLFPGLAAVLVFVIFPLIYTISIGFTNYSSKNLLSFERATAVLLDETTRTEASGYPFTLHADGQEFRLRLLAADGQQVLLSPPLALRKKQALRVELQANGKHALGEALPLKEVIAHQAALKQLSLVLPDKIELKMTGLREFGPIAKVYQQLPDGNLKKLATGEIIKADFASGFYVTPDGEKLAPGFKTHVGFANFKRIFEDKAISGPFLGIFVWTVAFSALTVFTTVSLGMMLAVLLNWDALKFRGVYQTLLFLAYAVPGFISILVFKGLFNNNYGEINMILNFLFGVKPAWFSDTALARTMLLIVNTWLGYPYMMVLCMGLIKSIPSDLYEASALAGAGPLTNFFKITMPLIIKPLMPLMLACFAFNFNNYVLVSLLTGGRPDYLDTVLPAGSTDLLVSYTVRIAFEDSGQQFGLAAAISTLIFILVAAISLLNMRLTKMNRSTI
ncbi:maltose ABC transporter permease MalF [Massilia sp. W12]|uniref:maltose ABC transporter permease MalF n=1 Tax=Massilia sp. W12 TaxID=3126507 RepID=UPI0030CF75D6